MHVEITLMDCMAYITNSISISHVVRVEGSPIVSNPFLNHPLLKCISSTFAVHQRPWSLLRWTKDKTTTMLFIARVQEVCIRIHPLIFVIKNLVVSFSSFVIITLLGIFAPMAICSLIHWEHIIFY
jgi:hypothetical protein